MLIQARERERKYRREPRSDGSGLLELCFPTLFSYTIVTIMSIRRLSGNAEPDSKDEGLLAELGYKQVSPLVLRASRGS